MSENAVTMLSTAIAALIGLAWWRLGPPRWLRRVGYFNVLVLSTMLVRVVTAAEPNTAPILVTLALVNFIVRVPPLLVQRVERQRLEHLTASCLAAAAIANALLSTRVGYLWIDGVWLLLVVALIAHRYVALPRRLAHVPELAPSDPDEERFARAMEIATIKMVDVVLLFPLLGLAGLLGFVRLRLAMIPVNPVEFGTPLTLWLLAVSYVVAAFASYTLFKAIEPRKRGRGLARS